MPRRRGRLSLSPESAAHALSILIHEGKLKAQEVTRALERREAMIGDLRARLAALGEGALEEVRPQGKGRRRVARRVSKAQRAARQAQGRYLGAIRQLSARSRVKVKAIREKSGVRAAVAAAKRMSGRPVKRPRRAAPASRRKVKRRPAGSRPEEAKGVQSSPVSKKETVSAEATTK